MTAMQNFRRNVKFLRKQHKLSQGALAEKIGVTENTVYNWERLNNSYITYPQLSAVLALGETFEVSLDNLFYTTIEEVEKPC